MRYFSLNLRAPDQPINIYLFPLLQHFWCQIIENGVLTPVLCPKMDHFTLNIQFGGVKVLIWILKLMLVP